GNLLPPSPTRRRTGCRVTVVVRAAREREVDAWCAHDVGTSVDRGWLIDDGARDKCGDFGIRQGTRPEPNFVQFTVDPCRARAKDAKMQWIRIDPTDGGGHHRMVTHAIDEDRAATGVQVLHNGDVIPNAGGEYAVIERGNAKAAPLAEDIVVRAKGEAVV